MKVYLDLVILLNFGFDFLLLLTTGIVLKRGVRMRKIILGSLVGALSILTLFISINSFTLFLIKVVISIFMVLISFGYKNIKYTLVNLLYLYFISIILGGFLYYLNIQFSYKQVGLVFINNGFSINYIFLIILSPIILYIYIKQNRRIKNIYNNMYDVRIIKEGITYNYKGFIDSGNNLIDPYTHKPIIIIHDNNLEGNILVPIRTLNGNSMLKCFKANVFINNIEVHCLVGISPKSINIDGVDCLINNRLGEYIC